MCFLFVLLGLHVVPEQPGRAPRTGAGQQQHRAPSPPLLLLVAPMFVWPNHGPAVLMFVIGSELFLPPKAAAHPFWQQKQC